MAAKDGVQGRRRLRIFAAAVALVLLCAVCVGGVSGAVLYVGNTESTESNWYTSLAEAVEDAGSGDTIIITEDYVIKDQVILSSENIGTNRNPIYATRDITITNAPGVNIQISSGFEELTSNDHDEVDERTLFKINAGKLTIKSNESGGSLTITTGRNGRAFDINFDDRLYASGDELGATLLMEGAVSITNCGFKVEELASSNDGGAVYIRPGGTFIMNESCSLVENQAGAGGAVYLGEGKVISRELVWEGWLPTYKDIRMDATFTLNGGFITGNYAINTGDYDSWGGGVWCHNDATFNWNYPAEIYGNGAAGVPNNANQANYEQVYPKYNPPAPPAAPEVPEEPDAPEEPRYYPIYAFSENKAQYGEYDTVREAYNDFVINKSVKEFTICLRENYEQKYTTVEQNGILDPVLDAVTIQNGINVTLMPDSQSVTLTLQNQMFVVSSGGSLTIANNNSAKLTVTAPTAPGLVNGGFVFVNGGSLTLQDVEISAVRGNNGGAVYLTNSGTCKLISGSITNCMASGSGKGAAVYVDSGKLIVDKGFTISDSNDVYLAENQVITITNTYSGSIGKITLSVYEEGRNVIDISANTAVSSAKFVLNPADANQYEDMLLKVSGSENGKTYLELGVDVQFTILIPAALELDGDTYTGSMKITAEKVLIPTDDALRVTVTSPNDGFILIHYKDAGITLPYTLGVGSPDTPIGADGEIARFTKAAYQEKQAQNAELAVELYARLSADPRYAGDYKDTLTFTVTYIDG